MPTPLVTEAAARDMAETAEWAAANIKRLGPVSIETAEDIEAAERQLAELKANILADRQGIDCMGRGGT